MDADFTKEELLSAIKNSGTDDLRNEAAKASMKLPPEEAAEFLTGLMRSIMDSTGNISNLSNDNIALLKEIVQLLGQTHTPLATSELYKGLARTKQDIANSDASDHSWLSDAGKERVAEDRQRNIELINEYERALATH